MLKVKIKQLENFAGLEMPTYETDLAAGVDLRAAIAKDTPVVLAPRERALVPIGLAMALPPGYEAQIRPRSGLAYKHGLSVVNAPGTIDADYRGELKVLLINHGRENFIINRGERIAQMIIAPVTQAHFVIVDTLSKTKRGAGGYGSTGVS